MEHGSEHGKHPRCERGHEGGDGGGGGRVFAAEDTMRNPSFANRYEAPLHTVVPATIHLEGQRYQQKTANRERLELRTARPVAVRQCPRAGWD